LRSSPRKLAVGVALEVRVKVAPAAHGPKREPQRNLEVEPKVSSVPLRRIKRQRRSRVALVVPQADGVKDGAPKVAALKGGGQDLAARIPIVFSTGSMRIATVN
jgi:hypothetical protein